MSEPRKNHLSIDGGQVKEDEHVASYKPIPESDTDFRTSKSSLSKSKDKLSADGAEEKLLLKKDEAKIVRVDMADAKYVVGDHRNGDAKIELDANKRQFSGLTKEELMKYADDPFWVNLRWCMFLLFWTMWVGMLAGAITIIVRAPKCSVPTPKEWFEKYPLIESKGQSFNEMEDQLSAMKSSLVHGIFVEVPTYEADSDLLNKFQAFVKKAKEFGVNVIVDLTPNYVSNTHPWFLQSENKSDIYKNYFVWERGTDFDGAGIRIPPNNWVSTQNTSAWTYSQLRGEFYLHQYGSNQPDLNFGNGQVVQEFKQVLGKWVQAGAEGVRLNKARLLLVNSSLTNEQPNLGHGIDPASDHTTYPFWRHKQTTDYPGLESLLNQFAAAIDASVASSGVKVFTIKEDGSYPELFLLDRNVSCLRPPSAAPVQLDDVTATAKELSKMLQGHWPLVQLKSDPESGPEVALFSMLLPASPVLDLHQILRVDNDTTLSELAALRTDPSFEHGRFAVVAVPAADTAGPDAPSVHKLLACARWKSGHTGYVGVFNPGREAVRANLTGVPSVPAALTVRLVSTNVKLATNYTSNFAEQADNVLVPGKSTVVLTYVPLTTAES